MSDEPRKTAVTVVIAGDEYTIRSEAPPEYTRECAAYVDHAIGEILRQGSLVEVHKAVILAALSLVDQLFQTRTESEVLRREFALLADNLAADIEARTAPDGPPGALHPMPDSR